MSDFPISWTFPYWRPFLFPPFSFYKTVSVSDCVCVRLCVRASVHVCASSSACAYHVMWVCAVCVWVHACVRRVSLPVRVSAKFVFVFVCDPFIKNIDLCNKSYREHSEDLIVGVGGEIFTTLGEHALPDGGGVLEAHDIRRSLLWLGEISPASQPGLCK